MRADAQVRNRSTGRRRRAIVAALLSLDLCGLAWSAAAEPATETSTGSASGSVITVMPTHQRIVALTFDGGANAAGAASILQTLRHDGVPATFFLTGQFAQHYPTLSRRLAAAGRIGDHTVTHPHLPKLSDAAVRRQVAGARTAIIASTGVDPKPLFRFPYGDYDARTLRLVSTAGWLVVGWTVDSLGWKGTAGSNDATAVVRRVVAARRPGEIVLMHLGSNPYDHSTLDAAALPRVIRRLRSYGYRFVALSPARLRTTAAGSTGMR